MPAPVGARQLRPDVTFHHRFARTQIRPRRSQEGRQQRHGVPYPAAQGGTDMTGIGPRVDIRRGPRRRPAAEVREEVLQAAGELLLEEGMAAFTIEKAAS
jgi:hypothetical protein